MDKNHLIGRAERLAALHAEGHPLVLPTVWDAWSARTAVRAGFTALTIGSHPLADSRGAEDHEGQSFGEVVAAVRPIIASVDVPVSVDLEAGYGQDPADLIAGLLEAGGVGLNVEDTVHSQGGRVRSTEEHAAYVAGPARGGRQRRGAGVDQRPHGPVPARRRPRGGARRRDRSVAGPGRGGREQRLPRAHPGRRRVDHRGRRGGAGARQLHRPPGQARSRPLRRARRRAASPSARCCRPR